jgi:hypothetical protein
LPRASRAVFAEPPSLFRPNLERAIIGASARRMRAEGDLDAPAIVRMIARMDLPRPLPRRLVPSMRGGVQVIVDRSEWMAPFHADTARLVARFRSVVGEGIEELWVPDVPPDVMAPTADGTSRWTAPKPGTAVVVVSDIGRAADRRGRRSQRGAWQAFLRAIKSGGFDPLVIVPGRQGSYVDADRAPEHAPLLGWDRTARVADVGRLPRRRSR